MTVLARPLVGLRRTIVGHWPLVIALMAWPVLLAGDVSSAAVMRGELGVVFLMVVLATALAWSAVREALPGRLLTAVSGGQELELAVPIVTSVYVLFAVTGGAHSFLYPLLYAFVSFALVVHRTQLGAAGMLLTIAILEVVPAVRSNEGTAWRLCIEHLCYVGFFAVGHRLVLDGLTRRLHREHESRIGQELERMRQEARDFRLISSQLPAESRGRSRADEEVRMVHSAVESIHEQVFHTLELLRSALGLHSAVLLWCQAPAVGQEDSRKAPRLAIKEVSSASDNVAGPGPLSGAGLVTSVVADPRPLRLHNLGGRRVPPYYEGAEPVTDLCAVPLLRGSHLRGILCADRTGQQPFSGAEEAVLQRAAAHILRVVEHERVFSAVERSKYEQEQFYRASDLLNSALTADEVYEKSFAAVRAIAGYDLAVLSSYDGAQHRVVAIDGGPATQEEGPWRAVAGGLRGLEFDDPASLVAMALKNRHFMPAAGDRIDEDTVIWTDTTRLPPAKSVLVLPLLRGDENLGALTLASTRPQCFPPQLREMLRVIGHQVTVSWQNARMYERMEQRATTDGLTGLTNHRAFQERLALLHGLAERSGQRYSVILTDIDHFKSINDTYGHPVGDQVLKRVAALFAGRARKVDIVARYGGEEFVLVLPDTDGAGAELFANRLREELAEMSMVCDTGTFHCTISMGIAEFPQDGTDRLALIEKADQALYWCKEHGRNCAHRFSAGAR